MEKILSVKDVAELLDVCEKTVRRWIYSGELKAECQCYKWGYAITVDNLIDFVYGNPQTSDKYGSHLLEFLNQLHS